MRRSSSAAHLPSSAGRSVRRSNSCNPRTEVNSDKDPCILSTVSILPQLAKDLCVGAFQSSRGVSTAEPEALHFEGLRVSTVDGRSGGSQDLEFKQYLPQDFENNNFPVKSHDSYAFIEGLDSEDYAQLNDFLIIATAKTFGGSLDVDKFGSLKSDDGHIKQMERSVRNVGESVIKDDTRRLFLRESYIRQRNMSVPDQLHLKGCHFPAQHALLVDVWNNDRKSFVRNLEAMATERPKAPKQEEGMPDNAKLFALGNTFDRNKLSGPFHIALEMQQFTFLEECIDYDYPFLSQYSQDLIKKWLNEKDARRYTPFETVIHTDSEDRFKLASLLLDHKDLHIRYRLEGSTPCRHSTIKGQETPLDSVILAGHSDFTRFYLEKMGMTASVKRSSLLSVVCKGDVELMNDFWNFECSDGKPLNGDAFYQSTEGSPSSYCAPSPFIAAIDRNDIDMVRAILHICPEAGSVLDMSLVVLPYQYAMIRKAPKELINLLRRDCQLGPDGNRGPLGLLHLMKTALRYCNRELFDEGFLAIVPYMQFPDFALPEVLSYAMFAQFYDVVEHISELCYAYPHIRRNMQMELIKLSNLVNNKNLPDEVFKRVHDCLRKNGIDLKDATRSLDVS